MSVMIDLGALGHTLSDYMWLIWNTADRKVRTCYNLMYFHPDIENLNILSIIASIF